jgi:hypothetical protein
MILSGLRKVVLDQNPRMPFSVNEQYCADQATGDVLEYMQHVACSVAIMAHIVRHTYRSACGARVKSAIAVFSL